MKIAQNSVVSIHYSLTDNDGNVIDSSQGKDPLVYLQGHKNIIPGLEKELEGKANGDKLTVSIPPNEGYGEVHPNLVQDVPKAEFENPDTVQIGMQFQVETDQGPMVLTVKAVNADTITVDGNHPLAGTTLNFDVEVVGIREATDTEIAHGHVHMNGDDH